VQRLLHAAVAQLEHRLPREAVEPLLLLVPRVEQLAAAVLVEHVLRRRVHLRAPVLLACEDLPGELCEVVRAPLLRPHELAAAAPLREPLPQLPARQQPHPPREPPLPPPPK